MSVIRKLAVMTVLALWFTPLFAGCGNDDESDCIPCPPPPKLKDPHHSGQEGGPSLWNPERVSPALEEGQHGISTKEFPTLAGSFAEMPIETKLGGLEDNDRVRALSPKTTVAALKIAPDATVLDIGAGTGVLTFELARALGEGGKVFAADVDPEMIALLKTRAQEGNYNNVEPVLVRPRGVDPFYKQHRFDVIIALEMFVYLTDPVAYFKELRGSLSKERGRLIIARGRHIALFHVSDFRNFPAIAKLLQEMEQDHPLVRRLSRELLVSITAEGASDGNAGLPEMLARDLNSILHDNMFFGEMSDYYSAKVDTASEILRIVPARDGALTKWLVYAFEETGLFEEPGRTMNDQEKYAVFTLNKIVLKGLLGSNVATTSYAFPRALYISPGGVARKMRAAGYRLVRTYDFLAYFDLMEFSPN